MTLKIGILLLAATLQAVAGNTPLQESFESVTPPALPAGWVSSRIKSAAVDDFVTASGTAHSGSNALLATNATVAQHVTSPVVDCSTCIPEQIVFYVRRSSSFRAACILEASTDSGGSYPIPIGDTLRAQSSTGYVCVTIPLPQSLAGLSGVRFRWRVVPDKTGTTGTLRLDDVSVVVRPSVDHALTALQILPASPDEDEPVSVSITIRNCGGPINSPARVVVSAEEEATALTRQVSDCWWPDSIAPGESRVRSVPIGFLRPGGCLLTALLVDSLDQEHSNDTVRASCTVAFRRNSLAINEIMYAPSAPEPEWVEIVNRRSDELNLRNWTLSDAVQTSRHLLCRTAVRLPPGGLALLTRDSSGLMEVHPSVTVPVLPVIGFPSLNNGGDAVIVHDVSGRVMDSVVYQSSWGGSGGESLERIDTAAPGNERTNWASSRDPGGSTPGVRNSIARRDYDLALDSLTLSPALPLVGDTVVVMAWLRNPGRMPVAQGRVKFTCTSVRGVVQWTLSKTLPSVLEPHGVLQISLRFRISQSGSRTITASIISSVDEDSSNNNGAVSVAAETTRGGVCVNEIMYDPFPGEPEWIELFNCTPDSLDLSDWKIRNHSAGTQYSLGRSSIVLAPHAWAIVARDSTSFVRLYGSIGGILQIPTLPQYFLGKTADAIVLTNSRGVIIDSVGYQSSWGGAAGVSLEREDPFGDPSDASNWASSIDSSGGTPGRVNSTIRLSRDLRAGRMWACYDPGMRAVRTGLRVYNDGKQPWGDWGVTFFVCGDSPGVPGEPVGRVAVHTPVAPRDSLDGALTWSCPSHGVHALLALVDTLGDGRGQNNIARCTVAVPFDVRAMVINEIMYDPGPGKAEYIECLNTTSREIDMNGWRAVCRNKVTGVSTGILIADGPCRIPPGGFVTLASDSTIVSGFPGTSWGEGSVLVANRWGKMSLGNKGDDLILTDASGALNDSVRYDPAWHRGGIGDCTGRSLERIRPGSGSTDPRNWSSSVDGHGGTPGRTNSIMTAGSPPGGVIACSPNPFSPDGDGYEDFAVVHYVAPADVAVISIRIFDMRGRLVRRLANNEASGRSGERIWDGTDDNRRRVRIGIYVVLFEACDDQGNARCSAREALVVAGRL